MSISRANEASAFEGVVAVGLGDDAKRGAARRAEDELVGLEWWGFRHFDLAALAVVGATELLSLGAFPSLAFFP